MGTDSSHIAIAVKDTMGKVRLGKMSVVCARKKGTLLERVKDES